MKTIIFSYETGDYLLDDQGHLLVFNSHGLACQYLQVHYHIPIPETKTKKITDYPNYYPAPFILRQVS